MTTNYKNSLLLLLFSVLFFIPFGKAQDSSSKKDKTTLAPLASKSSWLYIKKTKSNNTLGRMIKSNAMLEYFSSEDSAQTFAEYHTCNAKGIFVSKFSMVEDSILINEEENIYKHRRYSKQDTFVSFVEFEDIYMFGFRNYHKEKVDVNLTIWLSGFGSVTGGLVGNLITYGNLSVSDKVYFLMIVNGVVMFGYSTWRLVRMRKMKMRSMDKFELYVY